MKEQPLVSIVCTVYNKAPWLEQTIKSFLEQETTFPLEILLIDDASTDESAQIMQRYANSYPELIRIFFNTENQGISKTWVRICQEARGEYIARCDGDDFWLDKHKLQKQIDLLLSRPQARWSNTDFDIYNENGELVSRAGFENGTIPLADTFEKMLATRGFTMASTWLVERDLMLEVNALLDVTTTDDTFNLQMDLFQRTELAYLPEATVAYVINQGSDSRPKDFRQIEKRFNKLLAVQQEYLDKYPQSDYREMLRILLERNNQQELLLTKQSFGQMQLGIEQVTIYFENENGFTEQNCLKTPLKMEDTISFRVPKGCHSLRIDLSETPSFYQLVRLLSQESGTELLPKFSNGTIAGRYYLFTLPDPQLIYEVATSHYGQEFTLEYELLEMENISSNRYVGTILSQELQTYQATIKSLTVELFAYQQKQAHLQLQLEQQQKELADIKNRFSVVIASRRWMIPTKIINIFRRKL